MSKRSVRIHKETLSSTYQDETGQDVNDVLVVDLEHDKGRGHRLSARVQQEGDGFVCFRVPTGIQVHRWIDARTRFSARELERLAAGIKASEAYATLTTYARSEHATRKAAGQAF